MRWESNWDNFSNKKMSLKTLPKSDGYNVKKKPAELKQVQIST